DVAKGCHRAAAGAGEADHLDAAFARGLDRAHDVGGIARGRYREKHVAGSTECLDLAGKHVVVTVVVADRGEDAGVGGQRYSGQSGPVEVEAADQLAGPVLRVGPLPPLPANRILLPARSASTEASTTAAVSLRNSPSAAIAFNSAMELSNSASMYAVS